MYTKLKWDNSNGANPVTVKIYRSNTDIDRNNLAALTPIATLTGGELEYNDTTVVQGQLYYYAFETSNANDKSVSQVYPIRAVPRRGPGNSQLLVGDYNYGYFGSIPSNQFINTIELRNAVGLTAGNVNNGNLTPKWHKFARNGKILMIPEGYLVSTITWKQLYDAGLVYGVDGPGFGNAGVDVNQKRQVTIGADTFWVRLMRGYNDDPAVYPPTGSVVPEPNEGFTCEWDDLVYPLCVYCPVVQRMANVGSFTPAALIGSSQGIWVQEKTVNAAGTSAVSRGTAVASRAGVASRSVFTYGTNTPYWWPVLELIDAPAV